MNTTCEFSEDPIEEAERIERELTAGGNFGATFGESEAETPTSRMTADREIELLRGTIVELRRQVEFPPGRSAGLERDRKRVERLERKRLEEIRDRVERLERANVDLVARLRDATRENERVRLAAWEPPYAIANGRVTTRPGTSPETRAAWLRGLYEAIGIPSRLAPGEIPPRR